MSASLECCLKSFVRDVLKKDDKFINFEKDKRTIKRICVSNEECTLVRRFPEKKLQKK